MRAVVPQVQARVLLRSARDLPPAVSRTYTFTVGASSSSSLSFGTCFDQQKTVPSPVRRFLHLSSRTSSSARAAGDASPATTLTAPDSEGQHTHGAGDDNFSSILFGMGAVAVLLGCSSAIEGSVRGRVGTTRGAAHCKEKDHQHGNNGNGHESNGNGNGDEEKPWQGEMKNQPELWRSWKNEKVQKQKKMKDDFMVIAGGGNPALAAEVAAHLGVQLGPVLLSRFADGEIKMQISQSCRGKEVFIIQPTSPPVNENLMELLFLVSTAKRASAKKITAVIPYYGYARADRKNASRVPIAAADVSKLMVAMGVDRVMSVDLHNGAIQGFFPPGIPMDNLSAMFLGQEYFINERNIRKCVVVSPDAGGVFRARKFQEGMVKRGAEQVNLAMLVKQRVQANAIARMDLVGDVRGMDVILVDDMVDTAGTLCEAAAILKEAGAQRIFAFVTHGILSGPALDRIAHSKITELVVTDSCVTANANLNSRSSVANLTTVSISRLVADGIRRIYYRESLSWDG